MKTTTFNEVAKNLYRDYDTKCRVPFFSSRRFSSAYFHDALEKEFSGTTSIVKKRKVGESLEGRPIYLYSAGNGATSVLLWSQMHGDESTATMAIADILHFLMVSHEEELAKTLCSELTINVLPMLNPDGAERFQRRTAQGIDMNRDALALRTPEANILRSLQREIQPHFGYNLHDQELSTVGSAKRLTAMGVLAPAFNVEKQDNEVRLRAKHLVAALTETMTMFIPDTLARYDDSFEPRAFGDNMQKWGTSTILIESGHALNDPEKWSIRKLNVVGILSSLYAIATGEYSSSDISLYDGLPFNGKKAYDVILRNMMIVHENGRTTPADIAISYQVDTHSENDPILVDAGDLHTYIGVQEIEGNQKKISSSQLKLGKALEWETLLK